jgi:uncharacterized protein (TIGR02996 family)
MTTESDFQTALDADPSDHLTRLVFADWLQDREEKRAEGYRALANWNCSPFSSGSGTVIWYSAEDYNYPFPYDPKDKNGHGKGNKCALAMLPNWWIRYFPRYYNRNGFLGFSSRQEAEDEAAIAYSKADNSLKPGD